MQTAVPAGEAASNRWAPAPHWAKEFKDEWKFRCVLLVMDESAIAGLTKPRRRACLGNGHSWGVSKMSLALGPG